MGLQKIPVAVKTVFKFGFPFLLFLAGSISFLAENISITHDTLQSYLMYFYQVKGLTRGVLPYWNPYIHAGEPSFVYSLWNLMLVPTFPIVYVLKIFLFEDVLLMYYVNVFALVFIFALGGYFLSTLVLSDKRSSYFTYVLLLFSGVPLMWFHQIYHLLIIYTAPWFLYFFIKWLRSDRFEFLLAATITAGIGFSGHYFIYSVTAYLLFSIYFLIIFIAEYNLLNILWQRKYKLISMLPIFFMLLLPLIEIYLNINSGFASPSRQNTESINASLSIAGSHGVGRPEALLWSIHFDPSFLWRGKGFYPFEMGAGYTSGMHPMIIEQLVYIGIIAFVLMLIGLFRSKNPLKWPLALTLFSLVFLFLGEASFLHEIFYYSIPVFKKIRNLEFFCGPIILTAGLLSGMGVDLLLSDDNKGALRIAKVLVLLFFIGISVLFAFPFFSECHEGYIKLSGSGSAYAHSVIFLGLFIAAIYKLESGKKENSGRIFLLMIIIMSIYNGLLLYSYTFSERSFYHYTDIPETQVEKDKYNFQFTFGRVPFRKRNPQNIYWPYDPLVSETMTYLVERDSSVWGVPRNFYGYLMRSSQYPHLYLYSKLKLYDMVASGGLEDPELAAAAAMVEDQSLFDQFPKGIVSENGGIKLAELSPPASEDILAHEVSYEDVNIVQFDPNTFIFDIELERPKFLVYFDNYYEGWNATIDGKPARIYKTNGSFKGLYVDSGSHRIKFFFTPRFRYLILEYYLLVFIGGALCIVLIFRGRSKGLEPK